MSSAPTRDDFVGDAAIKMMEWALLRARIDERPDEVLYDMHDWLMIANGWSKP